MGYRYKWRVEWVWLTHELTKNKTCKDYVYRLLVISIKSQYDHCDALELNWRRYQLIQFNWWIYDFQFQYFVNYCATWITHYFRDSERNRKESVFCFTFCSNLDDFKMKAILIRSVGAFSNKVLKIMHSGWLKKTPICSITPNSFKQYQDTSYETPRYFQNLSLELTLYSYVYILYIE